MRPEIRSLFDKATNTVTHVVHAGAGTPCAVIDPVLDYDSRSGRIATSSIELLEAFLDETRLTVDWILDTHLHADHMTGARRLKERRGGQIGIGAGIVETQRCFAAVFNAEPGFEPDGSQFDHLFSDRERFRIGELEAAVIATPGHTPEGVTYVVGDAAFVGDTLFMPDGGTARCDFPGGDAAVLHRSIERILALPGDTRLFMCHDYMPGGREVRWETTVAMQRAANIHLAGIDAEGFIANRRARDRTLGLPALLIPSVQVNMRGGELPPAEANGVRYLKVPLDKL
ncbi:MAG TPA: MBL fold metallo-hydrolase [Stellaceae bacterium]|jgi:glyoxylase-like metal-dependent hydrolase (beta-lactamase superfamily II)|nr:MBL fold metallo-hydrolase [Stellaceae bacterium]